MRKHYIDISGRWAIILAYRIERRDYDEVAGWLYALGASSREIADIEKVLDKENTGFTFSSDGLRMSVMCIGKSSDNVQWWDTLAHEIDHVQNAIMRYYDVEIGSEEAAYLQGYIMRGIFRSLKADGQL